MHKPFIHCFKTAKEYYVYDVNTDKIIQVSFETYNFLENNIWDEKAEREIEKLINEGYLKRTRVEEVKHFATDFLESYLENRMNQLVLQVTQKCNLRCSYCVYSGDYKNRNHSQKEMSWETAKEAVDYLYGHSMSSEDIYISFYGGEPLLMFRLIKEVVEYVKREYCQRTVHFNLTTNGTLFTPEIVQYFIKNNISKNNKYSPLEIKELLLQNKSWSFDIVFNKLFNFINHSKLIILFTLTFIIFYYIYITFVTYIFFKLVRSL